MIELEVSHTSTEFIRVPVKAENTAGAAIDPTTLPVEFAFTPDNTPPADADYVAGSWATRGSAFFAQCLVGPTGVFSPAEGARLFLWIRVTGNPESPVRLVGILRVV